ncbi:MAG: aminopeptidase [Spirochaetales bacterium]|nr:aminopeptidase [Spirochaetales bacterium]
MNERIYEKIADLLLFAVNFRKEDKILLFCDVDQREAALHVAEKAYRDGAAWVDLRMIEPRMEYYAIQGSRKAFWFPDYIQALYSETIQQGWKSITIFSELDADIFKGLESTRAAGYFRTLAAVKATRRNAVMSNRIPWTLTFLPSVDAARKAFPSADPEQAVEAYWQTIITIMRLDQKNPVKFWKDKMNTDEKRSRYMDSLDAAALHFNGPGTDLRVGLARSARWIGGFNKSQDGQEFMANIPTDEIFTSPDWRTTEGRVRLTRPFVMHQNLGPVPQNAWFEFKAGKVVDFGADEGRETLENFFKIDERGRYLGEVALVDPQSPFARAGITFYNGLYDENAACHLALGKAYPFTLRRQGNYSDVELQEMGLNTADVHEDMMVGGPDVDVSALLSDGSSKDIIKGGSFLI